MSDGVVIEKDDVWGAVDQPTPKHAFHALCEETFKSFFNYWVWYIRDLIKTA